MFRCANKDKAYALAVTLAKAFYLAYQVRKLDTSLPHTHQGWETQSKHKSNCGPQLKPSLTLSKCSLIPSACPHTHTSTQILQEQQGQFPPTPERETLFEPQRPNDTRVTPTRPAIPVDEHQHVMEVSKANMNYNALGDIFFNGKPKTIIKLVYPLPTSHYHHLP